MFDRVGRLIVAAWDRLVAPDPGLLRTRQALRVVVTVTLTLLVLTGLDQLMAMPLPAYGIAFLVAQFGMIAVRDPEPRQQVVTILLIPVAVIAAVALASVLSPYPLWSDAGFLLIIFVAFRVRQYGPRYMAFGMIGFVGYYVSSIFHPRLTILPPTILAAVVAAVLNLLVRFVLLRPNPHAVLRRVVGDIRWRIARMLGVVAWVIAAAHPDPAASEALRRHVARLKEAVLLAEDQIGSISQAGADAAAGSPLGMRLFMLELAAEALAQLAVQVQPAPDRPAIARLAALQQVLRSSAGGVFGWLPSIWYRAIGRSREVGDRPPTPADPRIARAIQRLEAANADMPDTEDMVAAAQTDAPVSPVQPASDPSPQPWLSPVLRDAIQVTVASAAAIGLGEMVSPHRWYWGVIATFVMFTGTGPRGVTVTKALQRMVGTVAGVAIGLLLAGAVAGKTVLILALALGADFLAFQAFQTSYGVMMFWITVMLSLLYAFLGKFSISLLTLRLEETGIGIAAGIVIALLLLPSRTRDAMRQAAGTFLATLDTALQVVSGTLLLASDNGRQPLAQARALDRSLQAMRAVAGPLARGWVFATPSDILRVMRAAAACTYWVRELVLVSQREAPLSGNAARAAQDKVAAIRDELGCLRTTLISRQALPVPPEPADEEPDDPCQSMRALERVQAAVRMFGRSLARAFSD
jgi:hypothetical protein